SACAGTKVRDGFQLALQKDVTAKNLGTTIGRINCEVRNHSLMGIADHVANVRKFHQLFGCALRVATRNDNLGVWISRSYAANRLAHIAVSLCRHSTGV